MIATQRWRYANGRAAASAVPVPTSNEPVSTERTSHSRSTYDGYQLDEVPAMRVWHTVKGSARAKALPTTAVARTSQLRLRQVAHEMGTLWHLPWRTHLTWPRMLLCVAQSWLCGDMGPARRSAMVTFRDILASIQDHDATPDRRNFAAFVLLWARCVKQAAMYPDAIDGAETVDALEAVAAYLRLVRARYAQVFTLRVTWELAQSTETIVTLARYMRGSGARRTNAGDLVLGRLS